MRHFCFLAAFFAMMLMVVGSLRAQLAATASGPSKVLIDLTDPAAPGKFVPDDNAHGQVSTGPSSGVGVEVTVQPGADNYPGVALKAPGGTWDLSTFGDVQAVVTNTGSKRIALNLKVENAGDWHTSPWNDEVFYLNPGETQTAKVIFGYAYGFHPGFKLDPSAIPSIDLFIGKVSDGPASFRIQSLVAAGAPGEKPAVNPASVRIAPPDGYLLGPGVKIDAAAQVYGKGGASGAVVDTPNGPNLKLTFQPGTSAEAVSLKPPAGRWDLRNYLELRVKLRNDGTAPVTPSVFATSTGRAKNDTKTVSTDAPLAPGAEAEIVVPFRNDKPWTSTNMDIQHYNETRHDPGTGDDSANNAGASVTIFVPGTGAAQTLTVESIRGGVPPYAPPDWLGKRPPVEGDWTMTFDDEFDAPQIDAKKWNIYGEDYWDKRTHFTKDDVILGGGVVKLRLEKKRGHAYDDPSKPETDYATGYLDTYGKWVQRYGYFEARTKLPTAPGLWPCFWLMPDRGVAAGPQWKRADTGQGGMELDIAEYLSGWGPMRYNIGNHWDGYGKQHKSFDSDLNYFVPDKDGYVTSGLLWLPGLTVYYANGHELVRFENQRVSSVASEIIFDFITGGWDNAPLDDAKLPDDYTIDYMRVWQRKDLASPVDGYQTQTTKN